MSRMNFFHAFSIIYKILFQICFHISCLIFLFKIPCTQFVFLLVCPLSFGVYICARKIPIFFYEKFVYSGTSDLSYVMFFFSLSSFVLFFYIPSLLFFLLMLIFRASIILIFFFEKCFILFPSFMSFSLSLS